MDVRHAAHPEAVRAFSTADLRRHFLVTGMFRPGAVTLTYSHHDRMVIGGAVPGSEPLALRAEKPLGQDTFLAKRELAAINLGGPGRVTVEGEGFDLDRLDCLYVGQGAAEVAFESRDEGRPARLYLVSTPAHAAWPTTRVPQARARRRDVGHRDTANLRSIFQYVHPEVVESCQLSLGVTMLRAGSVWNTMPCHTHDRRMESYLYFDLPPDQRVIHLMGEPTETRHLVVADGEAVISPPWSIHSGAGTSSYAFVWAMAGDNKAFDDMDHVPMDVLR